MRCMLLRATGFLALVAFAVLGIVWSSQSEPSDLLATFWVVSFALLAACALLADLGGERRPTLGQLWDAVPGPSKNPDDYR
jgi:hypothetical protein